jgi:hypothetical protein
MSPSEIDVCVDIEPKARDFGCTHDFQARTYVVCLDCGVEFEYDWKGMRRGRKFLACQEMTSRDLAEKPVFEPIKVSPNVFTS